MAASPRYAPHRHPSVYHTVTPSAAEGSVTYTVTPSVAEGSVTYIVTPSVAEGSVTYIVTPSVAEGSARGARNRFLRSLRSVEMTQKKRMFGRNDMERALVVII